MSTQINLRNDDAAFLTYLTRGLPSVVATETLQVLTRMLLGESLTLRVPDGAHCELHLLAELHAGNIKRDDYNWRLPPYLAAFRAILQSADFPAVKWDAQFVALYEAYLKTPCADYYRTTARILQTFFDARRQPRILDFGSGSGALLATALSKIQRDDIEIVCVDANEESLERAARTLPRCKTILATMEEVIGDYKLLNDLGSFDLFLASMSLHHLTRDHKQVAFHRAKSLLKPDGLLLLNEMYGQFEGLGRTSFRLVFNVVKYYSLESKLLFDELTARTGNIHIAEEFLLRFFGREIRSFFESTDDSTPLSENCLYAEDWCCLIREAGFKLLTPSSSDGFAPNALSEDSTVYANTCVFQEVSLGVSIPLLFTILAIPLRRG